jgi:hypothetical protein
MAANRRLEHGFPAFAGFRASFKTRLTALLKAHQLILKPLLNYLAYD